MIPPFPLPSHMTTIVHFRVPNVEDGLTFCELEESQEESSTTQYLNHLQDLSKGELNDSSKWTGEDRRTALWWIFMATSELGTVPFSYECSTCGETHYHDIYMYDLMETAKAVPKLPVLKVDLAINGVIHNAQVHPMNGEAIEEIELLRNERDEYEPQSLDWKRAANEMAINEMAHCLTIEGQPEDRDEATQWKVEKIKTMRLPVEFMSACSKVEKALRESRHGLLTKYVEGRFFLVAEVPECPTVVEKGGKAVRTLLLPFHHHDYIAKI